MGFEIKTLVNGLNYAGHFQVHIRTEPAVPLEDFIHGNFDREHTVITYEYSLVSESGEPPVVLPDGTVTIENTLEGTVINVKSPSLL